MGEKSFLSFFFCFWVGMANAQFAGGTGTIADPYQITTIQQLDFVRYYPTSHFVLMNDVDFTGSSYTSGEGWVPIANFEGSLNGKGHKISNLYINRPSEDSVGLFEVALQGSIDSLGIEDCDVKGHYKVGCLVGYAVSNSTIRNSYATGTVSGDSIVGGLVGLNSTSIIEGSYSKTTVSGTHLVGGLVGKNFYASKIRTSYASGSVSGSNKVGGLVGESSHGCIIQADSSAGSVSGAIYVGGLIGSDSSSVIIDAHSISQVSGTSSIVGGLIGGATKTGVSECGVQANVNGHAYLGGLIGRTNDVEVSGCTYEGEVRGYSNYDYVGGLIGYSEGGLLEKSSASGVVFGGDYSGGAIGYSTTKMDSLIVHSSVQGGDKTGGVVGNTTNSISHSHFTGTVKAIGYYAGGLVGMSGGKILNSSADVVLTSSGNYCGGLVGSHSDSIVNSFSRGRVSGGSYIGGLAGEETGHILNGYSSVAISGKGFIGGLVGSLKGGGSVQESYATGNVSTTGSYDYVGGLVGSSNGGDIEASFATGEVKGYHYVGGLLGYMVGSSASVINCYSIGKVTGTSSVGGLVAYKSSGTLSSSYYNLETSGLTNTGSGYPRTTVQMKTKSTYTGWDFTNTWSMVEGKTYPALTSLKMAPQIISTPTLDAEEKENWFYFVQATDYDGDVSGLSYSIANAPAGMTISGFHISWTPPENTMTSGPVTVTVEDADGMQAVQTFTLSVTVINDPPVISSVAPVAAVENEEYVYTVIASDVDDDDSVLVYSISGEPTGMQIVDHVITWMPSVGTTTSGEITLTVEDDEGAKTTQVFTILVSEGNRLPEITSTAPTSATEDKTYHYTAIASDDEDADSTLTYEYTHLPAGMVAKGATITWTPTEGVLTSGEITLTVKDQDGGKATQVFTITVTPVNDAPKITSVAVTTATEEVEYSYKIIASDEDDEDSTLTYVLTSSPVGMVLSGNKISWTPGEGVTSGKVVLSVADDEGAKATQTFTIKVTAVNDAPVITSTPPISATEDVLYTYSIQASDVDDSSLVYSLDTCPSGMSLKGNKISWTPGEGVASGKVVLSVADDEGAKATQTFTIKVTAVNDAPVITSTPPISAAEDVLYTYSIQASDVDDSSLVYSLDTCPSGMSLKGNKISWTPGEGVASGKVVLSVADDEGAKATQTFTIQVTPVNKAPVLASLQDSVTLKTETIKIPLSVSDEESDVSELTIKASSGNEKAVQTEIKKDSSGFYLLLTSTGERDTVLVFVSLSDGHNIVQDSLVVLALYSKPVGNQPLFASMPVKVFKQNHTLYFLVLDQESWTAHIMNAQGRLLFNKQMDRSAEWVVDLQLLPKGTYFYRVQKGSSTYSRAFNLR